MPASPKPDFDGAWKTALQTWLSDAMALFWPAIHEAVDWRCPPIHLDKEVRQMGRILKRSVRHIDLLAQLRLKADGKALLLIHLEVQAGRVTAAFSARMLHYHVYLRQRHAGHDILSCAILLDRKQGPDTERFHHRALGCELVFDFPVIHLAGWRHRMAELERLAPLNPFAVVVLAQLECRATRPDAARVASKLRLVRALSRWGYDGEARRSLFIVLDALLVLPKPLEDQFIETLEKTEDPAMMQQLNSYERVLLRREKAASLEEGLKKGLKKGKQEGRLEGKREGRIESAASVLQTLLRHKFGAPPDWATTRIAQADADILQQWALNVLDAQRIEDVFGG